MTPPEVMTLPLDLFDEVSRDMPLVEGAVVLGRFARAIDRELLSGPCRPKPRGWAAHSPSAQAPSQKGKYSQTMAPPAKAVIQRHHRPARRQQSIGLSYDALLAKSEGRLRPWSG